MTHGNIACQEKKLLFTDIVNYLRFGMKLTTGQYVHLLYLTLIKKKSKINLDRIIIDIVVKFISYYKTLFHMMQQGIHS